MFYFSYRFQLTLRNCVYQKYEQPSSAQGSYDITDQDTAYDNESFNIIILCIMTTVKDSILLYLATHFKFESEVKSKIHFSLNSTVSTCDKTKGQFPCSIFSVH